MVSLPRIGPYVLHRRIAKGGMAEVFLARHVDGEGKVRVVALKAIRPEFADDPSFVRMFLDEARITRFLNHPNITALLDFGEHAGSPYLVMEYVPGVSLKQVLRKAPVPPALGVRVGTLVAAALHSAHEQTDQSGLPLGIVHRDVTPQNVMLTFDNQVKLLDFGIALARVRAERTRTGVLKGKWAYMSPEQVWGKKIDRRSDVFSLGALLYEMVTQKRAFDGDSPTEVLSGVMHRHPTPVGHLVGGVSSDFVYALGRCLAKEPEDRFQSASEVADLLGKAEGQEQLDEKAIGQFVYKLFPKLHAQIVATFREVEAAVHTETTHLAGARHAVEPAPFEQLASDVDTVTNDTGQHTQEPAPEPSPHEDKRPTPALRPKKRRRGPNMALRIGVTVLVGMVIGVGVALLAWVLSQGSH